MDNSEKTYKVGDLIPMGPYGDAEVIAVDGDLVTIRNASGRTLAAMAEVLTYMSQMAGGRMSDPSQW